MDVWMESVHRNTGAWEYEAMAPSARQGMVDHAVEKNTRAGQGRRGVNADSPTPSKNLFRCNLFCGLRVRRFHCSFFVGLGKKFLGHVFLVIPPVEILLLVHVFFEI